MANEIIYDCVAFLMLVVVAWQMRLRLILRSRGVQVTAHCYDREWSGQGGPQFMLSYTAADGRTRTHPASRDDLPPGVRVGDDIEVLYDPEDPKRVATELVARKSVWKHHDMLVLAGFAVGMVLLVHLS
ncbi:DUF3592 domain-containing protein [Streptomyces sp. NPDC058864]